MSDELDLDLIEEYAAAAGPNSIQSAAAAHQLRLHVPLAIAELRAARAVITDLTAERDALKERLDYCARDDLADVIEEQQDRIEVARALCRDYVENAAPRRNTCADEVLAALSGATEPTAGAEPNLDSLRVHAALERLSMKSPVPYTDGDTLRDVERWLLADREELESKSRGLGDPEATP